jgi:hypothetical protein
VPPRFFKQAPAEQAHLNDLPELALRGAALFLVLKAMPESTKERQSGARDVRNM